MDKYNTIIEVLISSVKDRFDASEEELKSLEKEWRNTITKLINDGEHLKCFPCTECGNILCLGDLCQ